MQEAHGVDVHLLIDLHKGVHRQGPGGDEETETAIELAAIDCTAPLKIADIGCGTGASTLLLARLLNASITAVDSLQDFLDVLASRARLEGISDTISPLCASMDNLPFEPEAFDVIWSEGAIYNIGFEKGIANWRQFLKPGGLLVVSEITWTTSLRPPEIQGFWEKEYPGIGEASANIKRLESQGYSPIGYFVLPERCWLENYYTPLQSGFQDFLRRHGNSEDAQALVEAQRKEIELYETYKAYYSYGVYIARKLSA